MKILFSVGVALVFASGCSDKEASKDKEAGKSVAVPATKASPAKPSAPAKSAAKPAGDPRYARAKLLSKYNSAETSKVRAPAKSLKKEIKYHEGNIGPGVKVSDAMHVWPAMKSGFKCMHFYVKSDGGGFTSGIQSFAKGYAGFDDCAARVKK